MDIWNKGKNRKSQEKIQDTKTSQMELLELKLQSLKKKKIQMSSRAERRWQKGKLKTEWIETEQSREKKLKKMNSLRTQWNNKSSNICVTGVPEGEGKKGITWKNIWKNNAPKFSKFGDRHKSADTRSWVNSKEDKTKEIHNQSHYQTSKNEKQRKKSWQQSEGNDTVPKRDQ